MFFILQSRYKCKLSSIIHIRDIGACLIKGLLKIHESRRGIINGLWLSENLPRGTITIVTANCTPLEHVVIFAMFFFFFFFFFFFVVVVVVVVFFNIRFRQKYNYLLRFVCFFG